MGTLHTVSSVFTYNSMIRLSLQPYRYGGSESALGEAVSAVGQRVDCGLHDGEDDPVAAQAPYEVHLGVHAAPELVARPLIDQ